MSNLEELSLNLTVYNETFIDGNNLKTPINDLVRLNKFTFNTRSIIPLDNQVICCVDYFSESENGQYHIYSYPYIWKEYNNITNHFPDGFFKCVCEISLFDERPFEHEFFLRISQSFSLMKILTLINQKQQKMIINIYQLLNIRILLNFIFMKCMKIISNNF